jgi:hypothetical protein
MTRGDRRDRPHRPIWGAADVRARLPKEPAVRLNAGGGQFKPEPMGPN